MDRDALLQLLDHYARRHPDEAPTTDRIRKLLEERERAFERDHFEPGHITASAWIVSAESGAALLTHHRKLDRWLQLGGHTDGETDVLASALREAEEESGLRGFRVVSPFADRMADPIADPIADPMILDVDVHTIPAHGDDPAHEHHDIRFLLEVSERQPLDRQVAESKAMRWFPGEGLAERLEEESLARMARKARRWLSARQLEG